VELEIHFVKGERRGTISVDAKVRELDPARGGQPDPILELDENQREFQEATCWKDGSSV
jgi:hypothetical protein